MNAIVFHTSVPSIASLAIIATNRSITSFITDKVPERSVEELEGPLLVVLASMSD